MRHRLDLRLKLLSRRIRRNAVCADRNRNEQETMASYRALCTWIEIRVNVTVNIGISI